jgi:hypothetical protein
VTFALCSRLLGCGPAPSRLSSRRSESARSEPTWRPNRRRSPRDRGSPSDRIDGRASSSAHRILRPVASHRIWPARVRPQRAAKRSRSLAARRSRTVCATMSVRRPGSSPAIRCARVGPKCSRSSCIARELPDVVMGRRMSRSIGFARLVDAEVSEAPTGAALLPGGSVVVDGVVAEGVYRTVVSGCRGQDHIAGCSR